MCAGGARTNGSRMLSSSSNSFSLSGDDVEVLSDEEEEGDTDPSTSSAGSPRPCRTRHTTSSASCCSARDEPARRGRRNESESSCDQAAFNFTIGSEGMESDEDSDDEEYDTQHSSSTKLLSLNEQDLEYNEEERYVDRGDSTGEEGESDSVERTLSPQAKRLEPVGVFWDIENCSVPIDKSAFDLATKMRSMFFAGKRDAEFMCVCDITKESKEVVDDLHKAQVSAIHFMLHIQVHTMSCA